MPWTWFLLRDALGAVSLGIAILMPALVVVTVLALVAHPQLVEPLLALAAAERH